MGAKVPKKSDRRVRRTHLALREALISLILERGWDAVSVQHLCARANVGRSTFYTHFGDKEELLLGGFDDLHAALRKQDERATGDRSRFGFLPGLIEHVRSHHRLYQALHGRRSGQVVHKRFRDVIVGLIREDLDGVRAAERDAVAHFLGGALVEMLLCWIAARNAMSAKELDRRFRRMSAPVVKASSGPAPGRH